LAGAAAAEHSRRAVPTTIASDRYLYLPILAAALAAALARSSRRLRQSRSPESGTGSPSRLRSPELARVRAVLALAGYWAWSPSRARQWEDEHRLWNRVNEVAPHHMAYYMLGNLASKEENWTQAADLYAKALELAQLDLYAKQDPMFSQAVLQSSRKAASELDKQPAAAAQQDREALLQRVNEVAAEAAANLPANPEIQFELGKTLYKQKKYDEAIAALDAALALDPRHYQALTYKAMSLYFKGSKEQAIAAFRESLAIQPYWVTYSNLGKVYLAESNPPRPWV
jgi:tetratricopeptide (TPR) repeat protein